MKKNIFCSNYSHLDMTLVSFDSKQILRISKSDTLRIQVFFTQSHLKCAMTLLSIIEIGTSTHHL